MLPNVLLIKSVYRFKQLAKRFLEKMQKCLNVIKHFYTILKLSVFDYSSKTKASKNNFAVFKYSYQGLKNGIEVGKFRPKNERI